MMEYKRVMDVGDDTIAREDLKRINLKNNERRRLKMAEEETKTEESVEESEEESESTPDSEESTEEESEDDSE